MESVSLRTKLTVPWGWKNVAAGIVLGLVGLGLVAVAAVIVGVIAELRDPGSATPESVVTAVALAGTGVLGVVWVLIAWGLGPARYGVDFVSAYRLRLAQAGRPLLMAGAALGLSLAFNVAYGLLIKTAGQDRFLPKELDLSLRGPWWAAAVAMIVLWGPFTEELFFRGFVFAGLIGRWGPVGAAVASSLLFGISHGSIGVAIPAFVAGLLFAWVYYQTGSLWTSVLAHAVQNALALSVMKGT